MCVMINTNSTTCFLSSCCPRFFRPSMRKTMPRVLLLMFCLSGLTMLFVARCGLNMDAILLQQDQRSERELLALSEDVPLNNAQADRVGWGKGRPGGSSKPGILPEKDESHKMEMKRLTEKIWHLETQLRMSKENLTKLLKFQQSERKNLTEVMQLMKKQEQFNFTKFVQDRMNETEILYGIQLRTEYDLPAFNRFTLNRIYLVDPGLGKRVVEKPIAFKKKDILEIVNFALEILNKNRTNNSKEFGVEDFIEGICRTEQTTGTHYELYFRNIDQIESSQLSSSELKSFYVKLVIVRPFGPLNLVIEKKRDTHKEWINLIMPLSGRYETFKQFMSRFINFCIKKNSRVYLTVVYFGTEELDNVKALMSRISKEHKYKNMKLITVNDKFSRGRGLQAGALNWKGGDVLMFFCDVDVVFASDFLERCRLNSDRGQRVYYPIVFSLYNPNVVYKLHDMDIPAERDQLVISKDTGFWRDFGYGMTCQYRSDFLKIKGFDEHLTGWGGEDVFLYQKFIKSQNYMVVRATDPGIFHVWHEKACDPGLSSEQYRSCIRSKALNEASHAQLGLLAFKDEIDLHRSYKKNE